VRAREAAKKDQLRARHRLGKFLLRHGRRPSSPMNAWTQMHLTWVKTVHFEHAAQEATLLDYLHEVEHMADRLERLERALDGAVKTAPARMRVGSSCTPCRRNSRSAKVRCGAGVRLIGPTSAPA
jgi:hypothetical protein